MEIYVEYLLIDNLVINSIIILLTSKFASFKIKKKRVFFVSIFACLFSFVFPYISNLNMYLLFATKLFVGFIITLTLKKFKRIRDVVLCYLFFLTSTFLMGGVTYGLINMFGLKTSINGIVINNFEFPMGIIILLISIYVYLFFKLINYTKIKSLHNACCYDVSVKINDKIYNINGLYDTGNIVYDNNSNKPILIISSNFYKKIVNSISANAFIDNMHNSDYLKNSHYINIKTISNNEKILVFEIDSIKIYAKKRVYKSNNVCVGVSKTNFNDFDCILHKDFMIS